MKVKFKLLIVTVLFVIGAATTYALTRTENCATCIGDKPCNACKNCKYCKHCAKEGDTCGACKK